uniref:Uncharacterized protein n=1 Tax=Cacopsylla melanoneura TaxID=428564 RepID=A0A8D8PL93_9HEMI
MIQITILITYQIRTSTLDSDTFGLVLEVIRKTKRASSNLFESTEAAQGVDASGGSFEFVYGEVLHLVVEGESVVYGPVAEGEINESTYDGALLYPTSLHRVQI